MLLQFSRTLHKVAMALNCKWTTQYFLSGSRPELHRKRKFPLQKCCVSRGFPGRDGSCTPISHHPTVHVFRLLLAQHTHPFVLSIYLPALFILHIRLFIFLDFAFFCCFYFVFFFVSLVHWRNLVQGQKWTRLAPNLVWSLALVSLGPESAWGCLCFFTLLSLTAP